ncbi:MAG: sensor histidine kinase [Planctomycetota bacterium]|jgi:light-regulated signal transduction histidine kinase (bacteriophytochrome)
MCDSRRQREAPIEETRPEAIEAAERLEAEIAARRRAERQLQQAAEALERSGKDLRRLISSAAHDLLQPLRAVGGFAQLLQRRYQGRLDADADEYIGFITGGVDRMRRMMDDLMRWCLVDASDKPFEPADVNRAVGQAVAQLEPAVAEQAAEVTHDELPTVTADREQLVRLLECLISNAIKFRGTEPPRVHVAAERRGDDWLFSVRDNGVGVAPKHAEEAFVLFRRLHDPEKYHGTGAGLAIAKRIVQRHGGRIWLESEPGGGSTFCFTIPTGGASKGPATERPRSRSETHEA